MGEDLIAADHGHFEVINRLTLGLHAPVDPVDLDQVAHGFVVGEIQTESHARFVGESVSSDGGQVEDGVALVSEFFPQRGVFKGQIQITYAGRPGYGDVPVLRGVDIPAYDRCRDRFVRWLFRIAQSRAADQARRRRLGLVALGAAVLLPRVFRAAPDPAEEGDLATRDAGWGKNIVLALGMVAVFLLLYFAFTSPTVISRWTNSSYLLILAVVVLALVLFAWFLAAGQKTLKHSIF